ncbi:MAG: methyltransferase domain-containing protein [Bacteroidota bacterium]
MIDARHLKLIVEIDQLGSLSRASQELNLTQSALSHQLKNLEDYLGVSIFHRVGNQLLFTEAGKELRDKAKPMMAEFEALELRMQEIKESQLKRYVHGYSQQEAQRLANQASTVAEYLHYDSIWEDGSRILEVGCGVGAQTEIIAQANPKSKFVSIDISANSLEIAQAKIEEQQIKNVEFRLQDARKMRKEKDGLFDHVFVCFLLEHLSNPVELLKALKHLIKPQGTITVIEGDHGSTFFHPNNVFAQKAVDAQVALQRKRGGNANIGRQLYPLLSEAGYKNIAVSPRQIYVDGSKPKLVEGFIKNTFTAMIQGMSEDILSEEVLTKSDLQEGIRGLLRTAESDGVFSYTFFKARAVV